jgi:hypothetical protein
MGFSTKLAGVRRLRIVFQARLISHTATSWWLKTAEADAMSWFHGLLSQGTVHIAPLTVSLVCFTPLFSARSRLLIIARTSEPLPNRRPSLPLYPARQPYPSRERATHRQPSFYNGDCTKEHILSLSTRAKTRSPPSSFDQVLGEWSCN